MTLEEAVAVVEEAFVEEQASIVRYVVEAAQTPVVDDADERCLSALADSYSQSESSLRELGDLLRSRSVVPSSVPRFPLRFTHYNYVRPTYAITVIVRELDRCLPASVFPSAGRVREVWPEAGDVLARAGERVKSIREQLEGLRAEIESLTQQPIRPKGTSASRW